MLVTLTHPIANFTGVVTVLEKYVLPFTSGTASIDLDPAAFSAVANAGITLVIGAPSPAPPYDANLDAVVAPIVTSAASSTYVALNSRYGSRPPLPGGYEDATSRTRHASVTIGGTAGGKGTNNGVNHTTMRYPFRLPVQTTRWRLHVRNYDSRADITYTGAVTFAGIWVGQHALSSGAHTGAFTATPVQALTGFATPADGSEYVSGWVTDPTAQFSPYVEQLLSVAWSCANTQVNVRTTGNVWYSGTDNTLGGQQSATGLVNLTLGLLDIWIEVEFASSTPIVAFFGDSLTSGENATRPHYDSYAWRWALANGVVPVHYSYSGTVLGEWTTTTAYKWTKYQAGLTTKPDAAVIAIGSNDIFNGSTAATVEPLLTTFMQNVRTVLGIQNLYVSTVIPRNDVTAKETERQTYNTWLRNMPNGAHGVIDPDPFVRDPASVANILAQYDSGDHTHLTTGGYAAWAKAIPGPLIRVL